MYQFPTGQANSKQWTDTLCFEEQTVLLLVRCLCRCAVIPTAFLQCCLSSIAFLAAKVTLLILHSKSKTALHISLYQYHRGRLKSDTGATWVAAYPGVSQKTSFTKFCFQRFRNTLVISLTPPQNCLGEICTENIGLSDLMQEMGRAVHCQTLNLLNLWIFFLFN